MCEHLKRCYVTSFKLVTGVIPLPFNITSVPLISNISYFITVGRTHGGWMDEAPLFSKRSTSLSVIRKTAAAAKDGYLGLLPVRGLNGILMPNGSWEGWYFSEELKFANENGYSITVIKGYGFDKKHDVFKNFVEHFYNIKSTTNNKTEKAIAKIILNNLFGRFGLDIDKSKTDIVSGEIQWNCANKRRYRLK